MSAFTRRASSLPTLGWHASCSLFEHRFRRRLMVIAEFLFALVISMICAALLLPLAARSKIRSRFSGLEPASIFVLLLILFLATWAGGIWLVPFGPRLWGVAWGTFVVVGLVVALLMAAVS